MTLTSGIWFDITEDPYLPPAPKAWAWGGTSDAVRYDMIDRQFEWRTLYTTPIMATENVPELTYFWFIGVSGLSEGTRREYQDPNGIVYGYNVYPFEYTDNKEHWDGSNPYHRTYYQETFGLAPDGNLVITSPLAQFGYPILNYWQKETGKLSRVPDYQEYEVYGRTPYFWQGLDLAECLWTWTTFYNNTGSPNANGRDLLDYYSFTQYSEDNDRSSLDRAKFDVWREHGKKVEEGVVELCSEAGAWCSFVSSGLDSACEYKFSIKHRHYPRPLGETLDFDNTKNKSLMSFPTMRYVNDYATNAVETVWGSFSVNDLPTSDEGDAITPTRLQSGDRLQNDFNVIREENVTSITRLGELDTEILCRHIQDPVMASARMRTTLPRFSSRLRELQFEMGPLHYKWRIGQVVPVTCTKYGIDNVKFLITNKTVTLWPFPQASIEMLELVEEPVTISPYDESVKDNLLGYWLADSGLTFDGGPVTVSEWGAVADRNDSSQMMYNNIVMSELLRIGDYQNGRDFLFCDGTDRAMRLGSKYGFNTKTVDEYDTWPHGDFTFITVWHPRANNSTQALWNIKAFSGDPWVERELTVGKMVDKYFLSDGEQTLISIDDVDTSTPHIWSVVARRGVGENYSYNRVEMYKNMEHVELTFDKYTHFRVNAGEYAGLSVIYSGLDLGHPTFGMRTPDYGGTISTEWPLDARVGATAVYDRALLPHELDKIIHYFAEYYNIEV